MDIKTFREGTLRRPPGDHLLVIGEGRMSTHPFGDEVTIGRDAECDVTLAHDLLSRRHVIVRRGPPLTVQDLGSTNGTQVGGTKVYGGEPVTISGGDSFQIGPFTVVVSARRTGAETASEPVASLTVRDPTFEGISGTVRDFATSGVNLVILGETGVGKEVLAETMHRASKRRGALVRINCAALNASLLEAELFGHEKGAFTGATGAREGLLEAAHGGTVFLDEVGELSEDLQAKLLRAVEQREVTRLGSTRPVEIDIRFIAATNRDLQVEVDAGRFRRDLFFRLDGITLSIPPLRTRPEQIGPLALHFIAGAQARAGRGAGSAKLPTETLAALEAYSWPGNVRELKAVIERALLLSRGGDPLVEHLVFSSRPAAPEPVAAASPKAEDAGSDLTEEQRTERKEIMRALDECAGNQTRAAKRLGVSRTTLVNKMGLYRIPRPRS